MSDSEQKMLADVVDGLVIHMRRLQLPKFQACDGSVWFAYQKRSSEYALIDKGIENAADRLRPQVQNFYEKMFDEVTNRLNGGEEILRLMWMRLFDTFKYVATFTGKLHGTDVVTGIDKKIAKAELAKRGLWKNK